VYGSPDGLLSGLPEQESERLRDRESCVLFRFLYPLPLKNVRAYMYIDFSSATTVEPKSVRTIGS